LGLAVFVFSHRGHREGNKAAHAVSGLPQPLDPLHRRLTPVGRFRLAATSVLAGAKESSFETARTRMTPFRERIAGHTNSVFHPVDRRMKSSRVREPSCYDAEPQ